MTDVSRAIAELVERLDPGAEVVEVAPLAPDAAVSGAARKAAGYGAPLRITVREKGGGVRRLVLRTATANEFGHDRRSDRAEAMLLAYDTFSALPRHVRALDVGAVRADGRLVSLQGAGEIYLLTEFAEGTLYAADLRRIAAEGECRPEDLLRCEALARYLAGLHAVRLDAPVAWRRALRDLVGHGEGIFGIVDAYPGDVPGARPERLRRIEEAAAAWRWRLRDRVDRLARTHGDFHPFNVLFSAGTGFTLLDASRGCAGDPADDATAMAVNYVFFALHRRASWERGLGPLWRRFWDVYLAATGDAEVLESAPPYLAWRGLVLASPRFYPDLEPGARDALLGLVERVLAAGRLDPAIAAELFA